MPLPRVQMPLRCPFRATQVVGRRSEVSREPLASVSRDPRESVTDIVQHRERPAESKASPRPSLVEADRFLHRGTIARNPPNRRVKWDRCAPRAWLIPPQFVPREGDPYRRRERAEPPPRDSRQSSSSRTATARPDRTSSRLAWEPSPAASTALPAHRGGILSASQRSHASSHQHGPSARCGACSSERAREVDRRASRIPAPPRVPTRDHARRRRLPGSPRDRRRVARRTSRSRISPRL